MKLAILLLCHKNAEQINLFLKILQNKNIEFFIHVDKKFEIEKHLISRSDIHLLPEHMRVDVQWAGYSQIQATLNLLNYAFKNGSFDYFWLCSGQDFPLKTSQTILNYLTNNQGKNFICFIKSANNGICENNYDKRNALYYPYFTMGKSLKKRIIKRIYVEITGGYNYTPSFFRRRDEISKIKSYFGSQWFCITREFVQWLLKYIHNNRWYTEDFKHCVCPDESFFHTLFMMSPYHATRNDYLHYIDWEEERSSPKILTKNDYNKIKNSKFLMARKFDITSDNEIIKMILQNMNT